MFTVCKVCKQPVTMTKKFKANWQNSKTICMRKPADLWIGGATSSKIFLLVLM